MSFYAEHGKRWLDLAIALPAIVLLSPVIALVAVLTRWKLGSPVLFRQSRPGLHERSFALYKFRTMNSRCDAEGNLLPDAERLTSFGTWMRRLSFDELPQLFNVIRGDMSLVGPRPLLEQYLPFYSEEQKLRHRVRPGITGQAQINGRNATTWDKRFAHDTFYARNVCFSADLSILFQTLGKVFRSEGVSREGHATMPVFEGNVRRCVAPDQASRESKS